VYIRHLPSRKPGKQRQRGDSRDYRTITAMTRILGRGTHFDAAY
jgi:hypothetical protein